MAEIDHFEVIMKLKNGTDQYHLKSLQPVRIFMMYYIDHLK